MTDGQRRAGEELWPRYGIDLQAEERLSPQRHFGRSGDGLVVEIGFGNGESLAAMAAAEPERLFVGVEVHRPGVGHLLQRLEALSIDNVRVVVGDAVLLFERHIDDDSLAAVQIYFPDPWPKKRHHKRRLIQPALLSLLASKLQPGGELHMATDWPEYAEWMMAVADREPLLVNRHGKGSCAPDRGRRPTTRFEQRGLRLGHPVCDLQYQRNAHP
jgi:tRNA (guanine-N7-)-methyltransferase